MTRNENPREGYLVLAAAKFAASGFHGTSLAALASEAGVTKQALLHFFGTKERLYGEVLANLAQALCKEIDHLSASDPVERLKQHFLVIASPAPANRVQARLVVRALLDSDVKARQWPMKPYLDRLVSLIRETPAGEAMDEARALAFAFQVIGAIQYSAIASPAVSGMYGNQMAQQVERNAVSHVGEYIGKLSGRVGAGN